MNTNIISLSVVQNFVHGEACLSNVSISLICVGEIAGAKMSDIKGLEEVRETPMKRQEEGNADNGRDYTCQGPGLGGNLHLWLHFLVNLSFLVIFLST